MERVSTSAKTCSEIAPVLCRFDWYLVSYHVKYYTCKLKQDALRHYSCITPRSYLSIKNLCQGAPFQSQTISTPESINVCYTHNRTSEQPEYSMLVG